MKKHLGILLLTATLSSVAAAEFPLSREGCPCADIVVGTSPDAVVKSAAGELQRWVREISGAELPIVPAPGTAERHIELSTAPQRKEDAAALTGNDGFAVRTDGKTLRIEGSVPKGVLNGVFRLLRRNTDIIWARPGLPDGTFFSKNPNLVLTQTDFIDIPAFSIRGWQPGFPISEADVMWNVRNCCNWTHAGNKPQVMKLRKDHGVWQEGFYAHNIIRRFIRRDRYWAAHPEWYAMVKGKRLEPKNNGKTCVTQLCFTNQEMVAEFIRLFEAEVAKAPDHPIYSINLEDNAVCCECPECIKPIALPDGKILKVSDDRLLFYSTRYYQFLNQIARHFQQTNPTKKIATWAYAFTEKPPAVPLEKNLVITLCPIYKDLRQPITGNLNAESRKHYERWAKTGNSVNLYDYYGLFGPFPRPIDEIMAGDLCFARKLGFTGLHAEISRDDALPMYRYKNRPGSAHWDANGIYDWVGTQLLWNPEADIKALRREYLTRVYGPAADDVAEYLECCTAAWRSTNEASNHHANVRNCWIALARLGLVPRCTAAIARARQKEISPQSRAMLDKLVWDFENNPWLKIYPEAAAFLAGNKWTAPNLLVNGAFKGPENPKEKGAGTDKEIPGQEIPGWHYWHRNYGACGLSLKGGPKGTSAVWVQNSDNACFYQKLNLEPGGLYAVRCSVKAEQPETADAGITVRWFRKNGSYEEIHDFKISPPPGAPGEWKTIEGFFLVPAGLSRVSIQPGVTQSCGKVWFADAYLVKIR